MMNQETINFILQRMVVFLDKDLFINRLQHCS